MRTNQGIKDINDLCQLLTYLYSSAENKVVVDNIFGLPMTLKMDENFKFHASFDGVSEPLSMSAEFTVENLFDVIEQLKDTPSATGKSKWDEILLESAISNALNKASL